MAEVVVLAPNKDTHGQNKQPRISCKELREFRVFLKILVGVLVGFLVFLARFLAEISFPFVGFLGA